MHRVVDPSILIAGQAGVRQGLFLYDIRNENRYINFAEDRKWKK